MMSLLSYDCPHYYHNFRSQSRLGDEEIHVVAAMLRNNITIEELQLRRNKIGDDGARAIAAVLAEQSAIKLIDLRENNIGMMGIKSIAEALERSERVQRVFVHPGGKIEAMGASEAVCASGTVAMDVTTICVVDVRENQPRGKPSAETNDRMQPPSSGSSDKSDKRRNTSQSQSQSKKKTNMTLRPRPSSKDRNKSR